MTVERSSPSRLVASVITDSIEAIGDEIEASSIDPTTTYELRHGRRIARAGPDVLWSFECDRELPVPPESPGVVAAGTVGEVKCTVVATGEFDVVLALSDDIGDHLPSARLSLNPSFILDKLRDRLTDLTNSEVDMHLTEQLLDMSASDEPDPVDPNDRESTEDQQRAVEASLTGGLRFVWGPPGTGKTTTLAKTVSDAIRDSPRVLVAAHSNAAVDVAMVRIADELTDSKALLDGRVLRIGTPQTEEARTRAEILPDEIIGARHPTLLEQRRLLTDRRADLSFRMKKAEDDRERQDLADELAAVRENLATIEKRLRELRVELILNAQVIGVTLSKLALDDLIWGWVPETAIVDEASMAGLPFLLATALRGAERLICFGDFRQLPSIAVSSKKNAQHWFGRDVFQLAGVVDRQEHGTPDSRVSLLRRQYRMGESIAETVSELAYFGQLDTDPTAAAAAAPIAASPPLPDAQLCLVDISGLSSICQQEAAPESFSRFNPLSASTAASVVEHLNQAGVGSIGVITPYRAQSLLLQSLLKGNDSVSVGTVHKFQGSERDAIIIDLVDALPQTGPSRLTGSEPDLSLRLLNVAISRARGKVILVADQAFIGTYFPKVSALNTALQLFSDHGGERIPAGSVLVDTADVEWASSWRHDSTWKPDLARTTKVTANLPDEELAPFWVDDLVEQANHRNIKLNLSAPYPVAVNYEDDDVGLSLQAFGPMPILIGDADWCFFGGTDPSGPSCVVRSEAFVASLTSLMIGRN